MEWNSQFGSLGFVPRAMMSVGMEARSFASSPSSSPLQTSVHPLSRVKSLESGMIKQSVLVVEDEEDIRELVSYNLLKEGYQVAGVATGEEALSAIESKPPDVVLLDLMLPGLDGLSVCRKMKENELTRSIPVIMLTAKGEESDIVTGLNLGADDYIAKPFSPKVLLARLRAVLRRKEAEVGMSAQGDDDEDQEVIEIRDLNIHPGRHEVLVCGKPVELTATEFKLLYFLAQRPGWVFTRQQILDGVHGDNYAITDRAVDVQIVGLRRKLGAVGHYVETVRGVGYRFKESL
jgi:two-component system, OmpR family, alkaline phosphatase synthesis response regulator PhoP